MVVSFYISCIVFSTKCYILCMYTLRIIFQYSMVAYSIPVWKVTLVQRRLTVVSDVGLTSNTNVGPSLFILLIGSTLARLIDSTLARRYNAYFQWFPDQYPTFKYCALVGKTFAPTVCLIVGPTSNQYNPTSFLYNHKANHHLIWNI